MSEVHEFAMRRQAFWYGYVVGVVSATGFFAMMALLFGR